MNYIYAKLRLVIGVRLKVGDYCNSPCRKRCYNKTTESLSFLFCFRNSVFNVKH